MTNRSLIHSPTGAVTGFRHSMLVCSVDEPPGQRIERVLGLVRGNTVRARHLGMDILATLRNVVGGEVTSYTKLLAESREQAIDRMVSQAAALGANAVVGVRMTTSTVMAGAAELLIYGTAVVLADGDGAAPTTR